MAADYGLEVFRTDGKPVFTIDGAVGRQIINSDNLEIRQIQNSVIGKFSGDQVGKTRGQLFPGSGAFTAILAVVQIDLLADTYVDLRTLTKGHSGSSFTTAIRLMVLKLDETGEDHTIDEVVDTRIQETGTATSGTGTTLTDTSKTWAPGAFDNNFLRIRTGDADEETRLITTNTVDTITVSNNFESAPANLDTYEVFNGPTGVEDGGTVSHTGTSTTLRDDAQSWTTNEWDQNVLVLRPGDVDEEIHAIASNTGDVITISGTFTANPVISDKYEIWSDTPDATYTVELQFDSSSFAANHFQSTDQELVFRPGDMDEETFPKHQGIGSHPADRIVDVDGWTRNTVLDPGDTVRFLNMTYVEVARWPHLDQASVIDQASGGLVWNESITRSTAGTYEFVVHIESSGAITVNSNHIHIFEHRNTDLS